MEFFFLCIFFFFSLAHAQCFLPNGTDRNILYWREGPNYQKCSNSTSDGNSMCCRTWGPGDFTLDVCEGSFCRNGRTEALWRESCSDPTWESDSCIKLCTNGTDRDTDVMLTECADGSICCGEKNNLCCTRGEGKWVLNGKILDTNPDSTSTSSQSTASSITSISLSSTSLEGSHISLASTTTVAQEASSATSTQERAATHPQNQTPIIAGSVVAGIAVLALILGLVWLVLWKRKVVTSEPNATIAANREHGEFISPKQVWELHGVATAELGTSGYTGELHGHDRPTELYAQEKPTSFTNSSTNENSGLLR